MPKRCPPGVFCIENVTIMFIGVIFLVVGLWMYMRSGDMRSGDMRTSGMRSGTGDMLSASSRMNIIMPNEQKNRGNGDDVFFDIYKAPLRDDRYVTAGNDIRGAIPINVSTQGVEDVKYRQVGILTRLNGSDETILPLMGRPLFARRDKWNFYTLNDKNNMIKLPVTVKGRSGTDEYGCDNVYNGDTVYVEGYNSAFKVTAYDNQVMRYLPDF
jgi:hypothetical protein